MDYIKEIKKFIPINKQEENDKRLILEFANKFGYENILLRENEIGHITSSGFIMNESLEKVLLIHHNIMNIWAWTGGHADGESDLLKVAIKEAKEETGIKNFKPLSKEIISIDILPVSGHIKNKSYVSTHLHLSIGYILICNDKEDFYINPNENSDIKWVNIDWFKKDNFNPSDIYLYNKIINKSKRY